MVGYATSTKIARYVRRGVSKCLVSPAKSAAPRQAASSSRLPPEPAQRAATAPAVAARAAAGSQVADKDAGEGALHAGPFTGVLRIIVGM